MLKNNNFPNYSNLFNQKPMAMAMINGSELYPNLHGWVWFYETMYGVLVVTDVKGLPNPVNNCLSPVFAYHIHEGNSCSGNAEDPFFNARTHYNPLNCPHPYHAGDLPPLFSANGLAFSAVLTNRFKINEVIGKTIIIHSDVDDFTTQPAGNSGTKIACGLIKKCTKN